MSATPIVERFHSVTPILGAAACSESHAADADYPNETYLSQLGKVIEVASAKGNQGGKAMFVQLPAVSSPNVLEAGDWVAIDRTDYSSALLDNSHAAMPFGVMLSAVDPDVDTAAAYFGWVLIEGKVAAKVTASVSAGDALLGDVTTPGVVANAGDAGASPLTLSGAVAITDVATADDTADPNDALPDYDTDFAIVKLERW